MKELFLPYELAIIARDKGFDDECFGWYDFELELRVSLSQNSKYGWDKSKKGSCAAPLYQQIVDWFRNKYDINIEMSRQDKGKYTAYIDIGGKLAEYETGDYHSCLKKVIPEAFKLIPSNRNHLSETA